MNTNDALERELVAWMADESPGTADEAAFASIVTATVRRRPRPRWLALMKEPPMRLSNRVAVGSPTARLATTTAAGVALALALAGAVIAASPSPTELSVGASSSPSASPPPAEPVGGCLAHVQPVKGVTIFARGEDEPGEIAWLDSEGQHTRHMIYHAELDMDDERLDGRTTYFLDWDFNGPAETANRTANAPIPVSGFYRGTYRIENEDGAWEGPMTGLAAGYSYWHAMSTGTGSGAYEGLSVALYHLSSTPTEGDGPVDGVMYPTGISTCGAPGASEAPTS